LSEVLYIVVAHGAGLRWVLLMLQHQAHSRNRPMALDRFGKIIIIVATRCHISKLKCTKLDFGWGCAPDRAGGAYSAPPDPLAGFKGGGYF